MKKSTHNHSEPIERQQYKKRYLQRILETKEAEDAIKTFKTHNGQTDLPETPDVETKRPM